MGDKITPALSNSGFKLCSPFLTFTSDVLKIKPKLAKLALSKVCPGIDNGIVNHNGNSVADVFDSVPSDRSKRRLLMAFVFA